MPRGLPMLLHGRQPMRADADQRASLSALNRNTVPRQRVLQLADYHEVRTHAFQPSSQRVALGTVKETKPVRAAVCNVRTHVLTETVPPQQRQRIPAGKRTVATIGRRGGENAALIACYALREDLLNTAGGALDLSAV
jgi:hypothetical protein